MKAKIWWLEQKWWLWVIIAIVIAGVLGGACTGRDGVDLPEDWAPRTEEEAIAKVENWALRTEEEAIARVIESWAEGSAFHTGASIRNPHNIQARLMTYGEFCELQGYEIEEVDFAGDIIYIGHVQPYLVSKDGKKRSTAITTSDRPMWLVRMDADVDIEPTPISCPPGVTPHTPQARHMDSFYVLLDAETGEFGEFGAPADSPTYTIRIRLEEWRSLES